MNILAPLLCAQLRNQIRYLRYRFRVILHTFSK